MGLTRAIECATATAALALIAQGYRLNHPTQFDINRHLDSTSPVPTLTPSPRTPQEIARDNNQALACYQTLAPLFGVRRSKVIIDTQPVRGTGEEAGTVETPRIDPEVLEIIVYIKKNTAPSVKCHEIVHALINVILDKRAYNPMLDENRYGEGIAQSGMVAAVPESESEFTKILSASANFLHSSQTAIPWFLKMEIGPDLTLPEYNHFKTDTQKMLYDLALVQWITFFRNHFTSVAEGVARYADELRKSPTEPPDSILARIGGYKNVEEFRGFYPFFGEFRPGPRLFTVFRAGNQLWSYYFTVLEDGTIMPLKGRLYYTSPNGQTHGWMDIKGSEYISLPSNYHGELKIFVDNNGNYIDPNKSHQTLEDQILIP